jgi:hypothetical protein
MARLMLMRQQYGRNPLPLLVDDKCRYLYKAAVALAEDGVDL